MTQSQDPRELARQLAEAAKARTLAKKLADEAKAKHAANDKGAPAPAPKRSIHDRAPKPMSAKEALRLALEQEEQATQAAKQAEADEAARRAAAQEAAAEAVRQAKAAQASQAAAAAVSVPATTTADDADSDTAEMVAVQAAPVDEVLDKRLPGFSLESTHPVNHRAAFRAVWTAHRARAAAEDNLQLLVTADVLMDAARRLPKDALHAARAARNGESFAVFIDTSSSTVLGLTGSPDLYLAGL